MWNYDYLETLAAIVQTGGVNEASRELRLTEAAVFRRIKLLEDQVGEALLSQNSPPISTPTGKRLIEHYQAVSQMENNLLDSLASSNPDDFVTLAVGVAPDRLTTWFVDAVRSFSDQEKIILEISTEDQEQTHRSLQEGRVQGFINTVDQPAPGCRTTYLGHMDYRLFASPDFANQWFIKGLTTESIQRAPALVFDRRDDLLFQFFRQAWGFTPAQIPAHHIPCADKLPELIVSGLAYGMLSDRDGAGLVDSGELMEPAPAHKVSVKIYWHCLNGKSPFLEKFTKNLVECARGLLKK